MYAWIGFQLESRLAGKISLTSKRPTNRALVLQNKGANYLSTIFREQSREVVPLSKWLRAYSANIERLLFPGFCDAPSAASAHRQYNNGGASLCAWLSKQPSVFLSNYALSVNQHYSSVHRYQAATPSTHMHANCLPHERTCKTKTYRAYICFIG